MRTNISNSHTNTKKHVNIYDSTRHGLVHTKHAILMKIVVVHLKPINFGGNHGAGTAQHGERVSGTSEHDSCGKT